MGLFSKKEYVCEVCGCTFTKRINLNGNKCDACYDKEYNEKKALEEPIKGYIQYASKVLGKEYTPDEMRQIVDHRDAILEKYANKSGISKSELQVASDNYKNLGDQEAAGIIDKLSKSLYSTTLGAAYTDKFFASTEYEGVIVDAADIFAVGYTTDAKLQAENSETLLCVLFTNDPYIPVLPVVYIAEKGFFAISKSKKGRQDANSLFYTICDNLKYTVGDIKNLKKQIKQENVVNGNIDMQFMLDQISQASVSSGLFNTTKMSSYLPSISATMLDRIGYINEDEAFAILKMDKMFNKKFWSKYI